MKSKNLIFLTILGFNSAIAQFGPQQIISNEFNLAWGVFPIDLNFDGDLDVLARSSSDIVWYNNLDGQGNFTDQILIENIPGLQSMSMFDFDGDGDMDILYSITNTPEIGWMENLGWGNFSSRTIVSLGPYVYELSAGDLDTDGDLDIVAVLPVGLVWFENIDGQGTFNSSVGIDLTTSELGEAFTIFDLDNDGDMDVISSYAEFVFETVLTWYENLDGQGNFSEKQNISTFGYCSSCFFRIYFIRHADINQDGKIDILLGVNNDDPQEPSIIYWTENLGGQGNFAQAQEIYSHFNSAGFIRPSDLDSDEDIDLIHWGGFLGDDTISWFKNMDGLGNFSSQKLISAEVDSPRDASAADLDNDGLIDVISASAFDDKVAWYKNSGLSVDENLFSTLSIYPNPTDGRVTLISSEAISEIQLFNTLGQKIDVTWSSSEIDLSNIESGIYFLRIQDGNGFTEIHKIIKK
jgi:Secretion system C-terminal sorting domain/FG-GAP-like repeat